MEKSKTFRNLFAIIKWECYNKQTCRVEIDSAVILVITTGPDYRTTIRMTLYIKQVFGRFRLFHSVLVFLYNRYELKLNLVR